MNQKHDAPEGGAEWKLVPVEPTEKMIRAAFRDQPGGDVGFARAYDVMLAAAPTPPAPSGLVDVVRAYLAISDALDDPDFDERDAHSDAEWKEREELDDKLVAARATLDATLSGQQGGAVPAGDLRPGLEEANRLLTAAVASAYADTVKFDTARNYGAHAQAQRDCQTIRYALERARLAEQFAPAGACADGVEGLREAAQDVAHRAVKDGMVKHWAAEMVALRAALDAGSSKEGRS
jgi:hypothetical protein